MFSGQQTKEFLAGLHEPEAVARDYLLTKVIAPNAECEFGKRHGFDRIGSVDEYRAAVPVRPYAEFAADIGRLVAGEQGILTTEPVRRFFMTSGSTAAAKHVPVTSSFVRDKSRAFGIYWNLVWDAHAAAHKGRMVTNFSDSGQPGKTPGGLPAGSESSYWAGVTRATQRRQSPILPKAVAQIKDVDARYYTIARILLEEEFATIMTLNPSTLLLLFDKVGQFWDRLRTDIERGGLTDTIEVSDEVRGHLSERFTGNVDRARALDGIASAHDGRIPAQDAWPGLELVISWRSPMLQPYLRLLEPHVGKVAARDYISMASEGIMAVPVEDRQSGGAVAVGVHFHEFIPIAHAEDPQPPTQLAHELEVGQTYVMVLTTTAGLYRYNIGDVVRVRGMYAQTPVIEFLHRVGATSSLTGEKLTEDQVTTAVTDTARTLDVAVASFTLAPAPEGFPRYVALVEFAQQPPDDALQRFAGQLDRDLEASNVEYGGKRRSQRLGAPELWVVEPGSYAALRDQRVATGTSDSQIKPTHLTRDPEFCRGFTVTGRFDAD